MKRILLLLWTLGCGPSAGDIAANLASTNPAVRQDSAKIARNFDDEAIVAALTRALADPSAAVRRNAVDSLAELEAAEAVPALIERLGVEADPLVQRQIIDALGRLGDPAAVPVLIAWIEAHEDAPPLNAIWALGALEDGRALDVLSRLRDSADPYVAWNATAALRLLRPAPVD